MPKKPGRKRGGEKIPDDLNQIISELNELGEKSKFLKKYKVSNQSLKKFLGRRGLALTHDKNWKFKKLP